MPLRLTLLESLLQRLNLLPTPLLDTPLAPGIAKALITACEIGIFDALSKHPLPLNVLAGRVNCDPCGLQLLLHVLVETGYLRQKNGVYRNTNLAQRWLTSGSRFNVAPYVIHSPDIVAIWDHLPEIVQSNKAAMRMPYEEDASVPQTQAQLERHYAGLAALATVLGSEPIMRAPIPTNATALLDVGGSHAAYSVLFCRKYPKLHATIVDIQPGIEAGQRTAKQSGLQDRLSFVYSDIVRDDFAAPMENQFDVALYFHIAHLLQPAINQAVLAKVARTLKPGGMLIYVDQVTNRRYRMRLAALMVHFMALTMTTVGGTCYPFTAVRQWLENVGMEQVQQYSLFTPLATMITAVKR